MKQKFLMIAVFLGLISCGITDLDKLTGSWRSGQSDQDYYVLSFAAGSEFTLSRYEGGEETDVLAGTVVMVNGLLALNFTDESLYRGYRVEKVGSSVHLIDPSDDLARMEFSEMETAAPPAEEAAAEAPAEGAAGEVVQ